MILFNAPWILGELRVHATGAIQRVSRVLGTRERVSIFELRPVGVSDSER